MLKKELGIRERRRIYEDAICIVAQTNKLANSSPDAMAVRSVKNMVDKQISRCTSILTTVLGCHEATITNEREEKIVMIVPMDDSAEYSIAKSKFEDVVRRLPEDKELKESMWKAYIKRDKKAKDKFDSKIA